MSDIPPSDQAQPSDQPQSRIPSSAGPDRTARATPWPELYAVPLKVALLCILALLSLIPLQQIRDLVLERQARQDVAEADIAASWGGGQTLAGPVLVLPFVKSLPRWAKEEVPGEAADPLSPLQFPASNLSKAYVLPRSQVVAGDLAVTTRERGIYGVQVYTSDLTLSGSFDYPDLAALGIKDPRQVLWRHARLEFYVGDITGLAKADDIQWNGRSLTLEVARAAGDKGAVLSADLPLDGVSATWASSLSATLSLRGSDSFAVRPTASTTSLAITGNWPHPSFSGAFLPDDLEVSEDGFAGRWSITRFGRQLPQQWRRGKGGLDRIYSDDPSRSASIGLVEPANHYLKSERAAKYGLLFVTLIFGAVFVCEMLSGGRIHPLQYGMVAAALCLFFLLLLSLAETVGFAAGYWLAALPSVALIAWYLAKVMASWRRGGGIGLLLLGIYGYLFTTLQSEDRALLLGSLLLFGALAATMVATRNLDWYALTRSTPGQGSEKAQRRALNQPARSGQP